MEQFTLSSCEMVSEQNMSETIICNHAALINPEEKGIDVAHNGISPGSDSFSARFRLQMVARDKCREIQ